MHKSIFAFLCCSVSLQIGSAFAEPALPTFTQEVPTPDYQSMLDDPAYQDGWPAVEARIASGYYSSAITGKKYINGQDIVLVNPNNSHNAEINDGSLVVNNHINSVQLTLTDSIAVGNVVEGNIVKTSGVVVPGVLAIRSGAQAFETTLNDLSKMTVENGGKAYTTYVNSGATFAMGINSYAQNTIVDGGEFNLNVTSTTAVAKDTVVKNGGEMNVWNGTAYNTHIGQGGYQLASGLSIDTFIYDGGVQKVYSGAEDRILADQNATIYAGGMQRIVDGISDGAIVYGTQVSSREDGSFEDNIWTGDNKTIRWDGDAIARNATIKAGGQQILEYKGQAVGTIVDGGKQLVRDTAHIENTKILNGGTSTIFAGGYSIGTLDVDAAGTLNIETTNAITNAAENVSLNASDSVLNLVASDMNNGTVNIGTLANNGQVNFGDTNLVSGSMLANENAVKLSVDTLSGNGSFAMRTDMANELGDLLEIKQSSAGTHTITFKDNQSGGYTGTEELKVVDFIGTSQADNTAVFTSKGADVGPYVYGLNKSADGNWYLSDGKVPVDPVDPTDPTNPTNPENPTGPGTGTGPGTPSVLPPLTNAAGNSVNFLNVNYYLGFIENQTLLQRMGELRNSPSKDGDVWMRTFGGGLNHFEGGRLSGFDMTYWGIQGGVDRRIELNNNEADLFIGIMGGYTKGNVNFRVGDGDAKQYNLGAYATYKHQNGFYVDALAKYLHAKNSFNTRTTNGYGVKGDGSMDGYSLGVEAGRRFYKDDVNKLGFYVEPQVQLTWTHMGSGTIGSNNGLRTKLGGYDSLLGRASAVVGYSLNKDGTPIDLYLKTGYLKEFDGDASYTFNNSLRESYKFDTAWWDNGIGMNVQVDKNKNLYIDGNYAVGGKFNAWQINAGYRQQF